MNSYVLLISVENRKMLPEEKVSKPKYIVDEKRRTQHATGMGISSIVVIVVFLIAWYFFVRE